MNLGAVIAAIFVLCAGVAVGAEGGARLRVEPQEVALGVVHSHESPGAEVLLLNDGDAVLNIAGVAMTCADCFSISLETNAVPPGGAVKLLLQLDPVRMQSLSSQAPGEPHYLVIESNDPEVSHFALPIHVDLAPAFARSPDRLFFDGLHTNSVRRQVLQVRPLTELRQPLTQVQSNRPYLAGLVESDPNRTGAYRVEVEVLPPLPKGWHDGLLEVSSMDPGDPVCRVDVGLVVLPAFHVSPSTLKVGPVNREQLRILFVRQHLSPPARLTAIELPDPGMRYAIHTDGGLANPRINLYIRNMEGRTGHVGDVVLRTDQVAFQEIRIPVEVSASYRQDLVTPEPLEPERERGCCGGGQ